MRLVFMGSPTFAVPTLDALVEAGHDIAAVYCQPPRPAQRGKKLQPTAVQQRAEDSFLLFHVREDVLTDGLIDVNKLKPVARLGGSDYAHVRDVFSMARPTVRTPESRR